MYDILMYTGTPTDRQIVRLAQILRRRRALYGRRRSPYGRR